MTVKSRPSGKGKTLYVEHGVWYDEGTKHIHVTIPGAEGAHTSYSKTGSPKWYAIYRKILQDEGRWPASAD